jgi:hypothetical protein
MLRDQCLGDFEQFSVEKMAIFMKDNLMNDAGN